MKTPTIRKTNNMKKSVIEWEIENVSKLNLSNEQVRAAFFHLLGGLSAMKGKFPPTQTRIANALKRAVLDAIRQSSAGTF